MCWRRSLWPVALLVPLLACNPANRDADGDGVPASRDCDDDDPDVSPRQDEVPYDGIDNDCAGGDLLDRDGDGWPGIGPDAYPGRWPDGVPEAVDCVDDPARSDATAIHPGADDAPYDGVDADCAEDDDFDADGDGHGPPLLPDGRSTSTVRAEWLERAGLTLAPLPVDDCDDHDAATHPGADDPPYDAHDGDCGLDDDYDADGDGWLPDRARWEGVRRAWIEAAFDGLPPFGTRWGDCLDVAMDGLDPAEVRPGAADPPYDGVDGDCAGDQDFDGDGDGYVRAGDEVAAAAFDAAWHGDGAWSPGDCDDTDPAVHPGAPEVVGDGLDADCDGEDGSPGLRLDDVPWTAVSGLRAAATDDVVVLGVRAEDRDGAGPGIHLVTLDRAAPTNRLTTTVVAGEGTLEAGMALVGGAAHVDVVAAWTADVTVVAAVRSMWDGAWSEVLREEAFFALDAFAVDHVDAAGEADGSLGVWACGPDAVVALDTDAGTALDPASLRRDVGGGVCFAEPGLPGTGTVCGDGCTTYAHDRVWATLDPTPEQPWMALDPVDAHTHGDHAWLVEPGVGVSVVGAEASWLVLAGEDVSAADGAWVDDILVLGAVLDRGRGPEALFLQGPPDALVETAVDTGGREPVGVAVVPLPASGAAVVGLALAGAEPGDDRVGWSIVGL